MKKQIIKVIRIEVPTDPPTQVFQVEIVAADNTGSWNETFNTPEALNIFLRSLRIATTMLGNTFNMEQYWQFDPDSCVKALP